MVLTVLFWILFLLSVLSFFGGYPAVGFGILLAMIGIVGFKALGNPFTS